MHSRAKQLVGNRSNPMPHGGFLGLQVDVLVTGSLHLVGGALSLLDPELTRAGAEAEPSPVVVSKTQQTK